MIQGLYYSTTPGTQDMSSNPSVLEINKSRQEFPSGSSDKKFPIRFALQTRISSIPSQTKGVRKIFDAISSGKFGEPDSQASSFTNIFEPEPTL
ncbi:hypothetical protein EPI10_016799 [Gossypium australe]|uniref:Uncharacterized protein n=1 Tax=Gossypium australe TaxID=47621 RepID=A0A5B6VQ14_9ROSI|nr:hypothetical protein EPI10_016799 [Gossypium australe]